MNPSVAQKASSIFMGHGSPLLVENEQKKSEFYQWAQTMNRPKGIVIISAHWYTEGLSININPARQLIYDYYGFPASLYLLNYKTPVDENLLKTTRDLLTSQFKVKNENRGWDHGVFIPLMCMYPEGDIPIVQISLPVDFQPKDLLRMGEALKPLRDRQILIAASGALTHNLRRLEAEESAEPPEWARAFDEWCAGEIIAHNVDSFIDYREKAPELKTAHPTVEHFLPLLTAIGAADRDEEVKFPISGFEYGSISRRCVQFG